jgi:TM2 domain-containing membrane protein YozV
MKKTAFLIFLFISACLFAETKTVTIYYLDSTQTVIDCQIQPVSENMPCPNFYKFRKKQKLNKRITASVLAFPFPFGMVGLHRIYLGTKPHVPVAYIASLGGVFGILPLIDFFTITFDKDFDQYKNNGKVFMWVK